MLESLTDFLTAIGVLWLLCIATPLIGQIRRESADDDIQHDWQDIRTAIRITHQTLIDKWRNR